ncbi:MAG: hypothetical protein WBO08_16875 [Mycobacterium sp.]|nr:hypothetical protein [Mycobacterium sp.]
MIQWCGDWSSRPRRIRRAFTGGDPGTTGPKSGTYIGAAGDPRADDWAAFALVLGSALSSWALLTVLAVACSREPRVRALLSREMIPFERRAGAQRPGK